MGDLGTKAEISNFNWPIHTQQDIIGFDITMNHISLVKKLNIEKIFSDKKSNIKT